MSERMMRIVVFSPSIVSDIGNPQATTVRALCQAFADAGCDVTHLEERGNEHLTRLLTTRGYAPMRAYNDTYPMIRYRQYEMLGGIKRSVWFGQELATMDAVLVFPGVPEGVMEEAVGFAVPQVVRFLPDRVEIASMTPAEVFADAVRVEESDDFARSGELTLLWDQDLPGSGRTITAGTIDNGTAEYVPEVSLGPLFAGIERVTVSASEPLARQLLPVASGCVSVIRDGESLRTIENVPAENNARLRVERMLREIEPELIRRQIEASANR